MKVIEIKNIVKTFSSGFKKKPIKALDDISFELNDGKILGVIGPNGSGKTTLFKCIMGFIKPDEGKIKLFEDTLKKNEIKKKTGFLHEKFNFYTELTPVEILYFFAKIYNMPKKEISLKIDELFDLVSLSEYRNVRIGSFSKGMLQRLGIVMTLIHDSELLIFDEPTSGLDPLGTLLISEILKKLVKRGKTIVLSSHVLSHIEDLCDQVMILYKGKLLKSGSMKDFIEDKKLMKVEVNINSSSDREKIISILEGNGYSIHNIHYTNQDLENLFVSLIKESQ